MPDTRVSGRRRPRRWRGARLGRRRMDPSVARPLEDALHVELREERLVGVGIHVVVVRVVVRHRPEDLPECLLHHSTRSWMRKLPPCFRRGMTVMPTTAYDQPQCLNRRERRLGLSCPMKRNPWRDISSLSFRTSE